MATHLSRRTALKSLAAATLPELNHVGFAKSATRTTVRTITQGPLHHWFGYYDKLEFDPTNRYVLSNQVAFEHRTPTADDVIRVGMVDTQDGDKWIRLGTSNAWSWQQGCMLQWRPNSESEVVWNARQGDHPDKKTRQQTPYLYHVPSKKKVELGRFRSPPEYTGQWRCDTHPRNSNDDRSVVIDSPHTGANSTSSISAALLDKAKVFARGFRNNAAPGAELWNVK